MIECPSEESEQIRDLVREFTRAEIAPSAAAWDAEGRVPEAPLMALAELGVLGVHAPESAGGLGLGACELALVVAELAAGSGALASLVVQSAVVARLLSAAGREELASAVVSGTRWGLGPTAGPRVTAGSSVLRWEPVKLAHAERSALLIEGDRGWRLMAFAHEGGPGAVDLWPGGLGLLGLGLASVELPKELSAELSLGELSTSAVIDAVRITRLGAAAVALGLARAALAEGASYAGSRKQFGRAIATFQGVGFALADAATSVDAASLVLFDAARRVDASEGDGVDAERAKLLAARVAVEVADAALQIHGGYGYTKDYPIERIWRDAKACAVLDGGQAELSTTIAESLLGDTRGGV